VVEKRKSSLNALRVANNSQISMHNEFAAIVLRVPVANYTSAPVAAAKLK
jgi:hypothetical protein